MNKYSFFSERSALEHALCEKVEATLEELKKDFLEGGFEAIYQKLALNFVWQQDFVFDLLVMEKGFLQGLIASNQDFFLGMIAGGRGDEIRVMLKLKDAKYRKLWYEILMMLNNLFMERLLEQKSYNAACFSFFAVLKRLRH